MYARDVHDVRQVRYRIGHRVVIVLEGQWHLGHQIPNIRYLVTYNNSSLYNPIHLLFNRMVITLTQVLAQSGLNEARYHHPIHHLEDREVSGI